MGKSIRSKIKRKHRAEFRATIGDAAFQATMAVVQTNLKENIEKQSLKSLDKLSNQLSSAIGDEMNTDNDGIGTITTSSSIMELPDATIDTSKKTSSSSNVLGENKVRVYRKNGRYKHRIDALEKKVSQQQQQNEQHEGESKPKRRPRFFCQF